MQRDGEGDARKLIGTMEKEDALKKIAFGGRKLALDTFKWKAIGTRQGEIIDSLCKDAISDIKNTQKTPEGSAWRHAGHTKLGSASSQGRKV